MGLTCSIGDTSCTGIAGAEAQCIAGRNYILAESRLVVVVWWWYDWQESLHYSLDGTINNLNNQIIASKNVYWCTSASIWCKVYSWVTWGGPGGGPGGGAAGGGQQQEKKSNLFFLVF